MGQRVNLHTFSRSPQCHLLLVFRLFRLAFHQNGFFLLKQHLNLTSVHLSYYLLLSSMIFMPLGAYELFMHPYAFLPTSPYCVLSEKL